MRIGPTFTASFLSLGVLASLAGWPSAARACQPPACFADTGRWTAVTLASAGPIPADGVLVVAGARWGGGLAEAEFPAIAVKVERDGVAVAGALEGLELPLAFAWRPAAKLTPGTYTVAVTIDNDAIDPNAPDGECGPAVLSFQAGVEVVGDASPAPAAPDLRIGAEVRVDGSQDLDDLVCCDGAMPYESPGSCDLEVIWDEGRCANLHAWAALHGWFERADAEPELLAGSLMYRLIVDGSERAHGIDGVLGHSATAPFCARVEVESLATGARASTAERCYGQDLDGPLGDLACDPAAALAGCAAYVCADVGGAWDPEQCAPWDGSVDAGAVDCGFGGPTSEGTTTSDGSTGGDTGGEDTTGEATTGAATTGATSTGETTTEDPPLIADDCGCSARPTGASALLWLMLLGLHRRRRHAHAGAPRGAGLTPGWR